MLLEIEAWCKNENSEQLVVTDVDMAWPDAATGRQLLKEYEVPPGPGEAPFSPGIFRIAPPAISGGAQQTDLNETQFAEAFDAVPQQAHYLEWRKAFLLRFFVFRFAGRDRFNLVSPRDVGDLQRPASNHLVRLFKDDGLRAAVSGLIESAISRSFVLDPTLVGQLRPRLSDRKPPSPEIERGLDERAIAFHSSASLIELESDGTQSFVGLVVALHSLPHRIILIDEPEAHLHPPLARRVGRLVASLGAERAASVVAATHSADFLMGCLEGGTDAAIVRLTFARSTGDATARLLSAGALAELLADPFARSTNALDAVFNRAAVICEADADRAFYEEVNRSLDDAGRGIADARFIGMHTWGNIARVAGPLRRLGVPAAMVLDLDTLTNPVGEWDNVWKAVGLDRTSGDGLRLESQRQVVKSHLTSLSGKPYKTAGVDAFALGSAERNAIVSLIGDLAKHGIFIVPVGELEGWLRSVAAPKGKKAWILSMLPSLRTLKPSPDDVWAFIDSIEAWVGDPRRRGTD
jgi:AAA domain, putative AbiEii toxin, Type IV TA system